MKKPKPLDLSSFEELSFDEMQSMVAGAIDNASGYIDRSIDSVTALWEASKAACSGKRVGDNCSISYGSGLPAPGKCQSVKDSDGKQVLICSTNTNSGSGSSGNSGGATWWDNLWNGDLKPQRNGCDGKQKGDSCTWRDKSGTHHGTCNLDYTTHYLLCAKLPSSGASNATGSVTARQAACLNKAPGTECSFVGDDGSALHGYCRIDSFSWYKKLTACYTDIASSGSGNSGNI